MPKDYWFLIIMRSMERVRTLRVARRTLNLLLVAVIFFLGAFIFLAYEYFSSFEERIRGFKEVELLKSQISSLEKKIKTGTPENVAHKPHSSPVTIQELKVIRRAKRGGFSGSFRLVNQNSQESPFTGTLAMVARNENLQRPVYRVIPEMVLEKGIPQQPEKGKKVEVGKQKFIETYFDRSSEEEAIFKNFTVFVFAENGKLILQKSIEIPENITGE